MEFIHHHCFNQRSIRIEQWIQPAENNLESTKPMKSKRKKGSSISNNAVNMPEVSQQPNLSQFLRDQLVKHLNGWHCLQQLYRHPHDYTIAINLSKITRAILSNSEEILILSTWIPLSVQQTLTNQVRNHLRNFRCVYSNSIVNKLFLCSVRFRKYQSIQQHPCLHSSFWCSFSRSFQISNQCCCTKKPSNFIANHLRYCSCLFLFLAKQKKGRYNNGKQIKKQKTSDKIVWPPKQKEKRHRYNKTKPNKQTNNNSDQNKSFDVCRKTNNRRYPCSCEE